MDLPPIPVPMRPPNAAVKPVAPVHRADPQADAQAREAAQAFEAAFLAEMLKHSGLNEMPSSFGGGAGEEAFTSFLTQEYAELMSERGGVGIAEQVFETLKAREAGR